MSSLVFLRNTAFTISRLIIGACLALFLSSYLARTIAAAENGQYALAILLAVTTASIGCLGLGSSTAFFVATQRSPIGEIVTKNLAVTLIAAFLSTGLGLVVVVAYKTTLFPTLPYRLLILSLVAVFPLMLFNCVAPVFQGKENFKLLGILTILPTATNILLLIVVSRFGVSVTLAVISWGLGYAIALVVTIYLLRAELLGAARYLFSSSRYINQALRYGLKAHLSNIVTFLHYRVDVYVLGAVSGTSAVGLYSVTVPVTEVTWMLSNAVSTVLFPLVAARSASEKAEAGITPMVCRTVFAITALVGLGIALGSSYLVSGLFGVPYAQAADALCLLMPGVVAWSIARVLCNDIAGRGRPEINLLAGVFGLLVNIGFVWLLIPRYGLNGAATASSISYTMFTVSVVLAYSFLTKTSVLELVCIKAADFAALREVVYRGFFYKK